MRDEKFEIKIETDPKTGLIAKMSLPVGLSAEERITMLIPFIDGLRGAIVKLDASTRKYSRLLTVFTIVLVILTVCLVGLGIIQLVR